MGKILIFSDGSSRGNPGHGGWGAIVVKIKDKKKIKNKDTEDDVRELGGREGHTTNNRMELKAIIDAFKLVDHLDNEISVYTDSTYVKEGITKWVHNWQKNDWKNSLKKTVLNKDLWKELVEVSKGKKIEWNHIDGHMGNPGNERCDEIATTFADNQNPRLFKGNLSDYSIDILNIKNSDKQIESSLPSKNKKKNNNQAYSYLSLVDGVLKKHKTWAECEKQVKGVSGAKFMKSFSEEDEKKIIESWGVN